MRWTPGGTSGDIEDRRDEGGGGGGFGFGGMHIGIGGMLILLILSFVFKRNLFTLLGSGGGPGSSLSEPDRARDAREEPTVKFISFVLDDAQQSRSRTAVPPSAHNGSVVECNRGPLPRATLSNKELEEGHCPPT